MNVQENAQQLVLDIQGLEGQLVEKRKSLAALKKDVQSLLATVTSGGKTRNAAGRPKGSTNGEISVSKQVLNFLAAQENGATRAAILAAIGPDHASAVNAAIRVHQQANKIFREADSHVWFYNVAADEEPTPVLESGVEAANSNQG